MQGDRQTIGRVSTRQPPVAVAEDVASRIRRLAKVNLPKASALFSKGLHDCIRRVRVFGRLISLDQVVLGYGCRGGDDEWRGRLADQRQRAGAGQRHAIVIEAFNDHRRRVPATRHVECQGLSEVHRDDLRCRVAVVPQGADDTQPDFAEGYIDAFEVRMLSLSIALVSTSARDGSAMPRSATILTLGWFCSIVCLNAPSRRFVT